MQGMFIALEGVDGVGKTTLAGEVAARLAGEGVVFVSRRQIPAAPRDTAEVMSHLADMLWGPTNSADLPADFWVHLQASWFAAHSRAVVAPTIRAGTHVIVDGWMYKLRSKLMVQGYDAEYLDRVFSATLRPDAVVLLRADASTLWRRRSTFRPFELGLHAGYQQLGEDSFVEYQSRAQGQLEAIARDQDWECLNTDLGGSVAACAAHLCTIIEQKLRALPV